MSNINWDQYDFVDLMRELGIPDISFDCTNEAPTDEVIPSDYCPLTGSINVGIAELPPLLNDDIQLYGEMCESDTKTQICELKSMLSSLAVRVDNLDKTVPKLIEK